MSGIWKSKNSDNKLKCGCCDNWLVHWERNTGQKADLCCVNGCNNVAKVGSHIKKEGDSHTYIAPMCYNHTISKNRSFTKKESVVPVLANKCN